MIIKKYNVDTLPEAVLKIKADLGSQAVVVSTAKKIKRDYLFRTKKYLEVVAMLDSSSVADIESVMGSRSIIGDSFGLKKLAKNILAPVVGEYEKLKNKVSPPVSKKAHIDLSIDEKINLDIVKNDIKTAVAPEDPIMHLVKSLLWHGVHQSYAEYLAERLSSLDLKGAEKNQEAMAELLMEVLPSCSDIESSLALKQKLVFTGSTRSGKSSTMLKLATHLFINDGSKIAFIVADDKKTGVDPLLRNLAGVIEAPCGFAKNEREFDKQLKRFSKYDHIFIELSEDCINWLGDRDAAHTNINYVVPMDKNIPGDSENIIEYCDNITVTMVDASSRFGNLLNYTLDFSKPYLAFMSGESIPEDYEIASVERIIDCLLNFSGRHPVILPSHNSSAESANEVLQ